MKKISTIVLSVVLMHLVFQSCEPRKVIVNREVNSTKDGKMLLGTQTLSNFIKEPYSEWYVKEHDDYAIDQKSLNELKKEKLQTYNLTVFLGTWCEDSHREFPRLMKILEALKFPKEKLTLVAVNRKKESPTGEEGQYNIQKVPTIIIQRYGREIGRIVESPKSGWLEKDLLEILKKDDSSIKDLFK